MTTELMPDFIFAGPSKAGSSWLYEAVREHPEVFLPELKPVNYFNVKYHQGDMWYRSVFEGSTPDQTVGEFSPGYIVNERAPARIAEDIDDPKVMFTLRNPIDRAFSHWWHDARQATINYDFEDVLFVDQAYEVYVRMGMYIEQLERWERHLSDENVQVFLFDDFVNDNGEFIESVYDFIGVDSDFEPSIIGEKTNTAQYTGPALYDKLKAWLVYEAPSWLERGARKVHPMLRALFESKSEYDEGMDENIRKELELHYAEPTKELEEYLGRDLNHWFEFIDLERDDHRSQVEFSEEHRSAYRHWETDRLVFKNYTRHKRRANTRR